jgi:pimeloyl-ACP methyl ester carboxylesterase
MTIRGAAPVPTFDSCGVAIAYLDTGATDPDQRTILLIHGFASNHRVNWVDTGWVKTLNAANFRVVAIDNRGHGDSAKLHDPAAYSAPVMAEDACGLLDHLGLDRVDLMGYSMGARISAFLTIAHPSRVRSVVFAGLGANMVRPMAGTGPIAAALEAPSIDDVTNSTARTFRAFAEQTKADRLSLAACIRGARNPITAEALSRIRCPALVAVGDQDVIGGSAEGLAKLLPDGQALTIVGRDHMKAVGDRQYKDGVLAFLAGIAG